MFLFLICCLFPPLFILYLIFPVMIFLLKLIPCFFIGFFAVIWTCIKVAFVVSYYLLMGLVWISSFLIGRIYMMLLRAVKIIKFLFKKGKEMLV